MYMNTMPYSKRAPASARWLNTTNGDENVPAAEHSPPHTVKPKLSLQHCPYCLAEKSTQVAYATCLDKTAAKPCTLASALPPLWAAQTQHRLSCSLRSTVCTQAHLTCQWSAWAPDFGHCSPSSLHCPRPTVVQQPARPQTGETDSCSDLLATTDLVSQTHSNRSPRPCRKARRASRHPQL